jgi:phosphoesterase RecJ-like protein
MMANPSVFTDQIDTLRKQLMDSRSILLFTHIRPDGDAIGSLLGLGLALEETGKVIKMVSEDGVPPSHRRLEGTDTISKKPNGSYDLVIVLDCSDRERAGNGVKGLKIDWNIDHHVTNLNFGRKNLVDTAAVATAEIVTELIPLLGLRFSPAIASALLTGLVTDTLGFQTSNMTPKALRVAANLMEMGADLPTIYREALILRPYTALRLWSSGLGRLAREDRIIWSTFTLTDRQAAGYPGRDDADFINVLSSVNDTDIAIVFVEQPQGHVKVSWRAKPGLDVSKIALKFGGGGHPAASGADIAGTVDEVRNTVLEATRLILEKNGNE